jgi:hypothetical protein
MVLLFGATVTAAMAMAFYSGGLGMFGAWIFFPNTPFDSKATPRPADYSFESSWASAPQNNRAWWVPRGGGLTDSQADADVDTFYVHPTTYFVGRWNADVDSVVASSVTNFVPMREQAGVYNGVSQVFAPKYRQVSQGAQEQQRYPQEQTDLALDVAYEDVRAAFQWFVQHSGDRPFIIGSHSQGTLHATRLLKERIMRDPKLRKRLVAAYLIGNTVVQSEMSAVSLPVCQNATQIRCYVSWNTVKEGDVAGARHWQSKGEATCVNPLSWKQSDDLVAKEHHKGAVPLLSSVYGELFGQRLFAGPSKSLVRARCKDGVLFVSDPADEQPISFGFNPGTRLWLAVGVSMQRPSTDRSGRPLMQGAKCTRSTTICSTWTSGRTCSIARRRFCHTHAINKPPHCSDLSLSLSLSQPVSRPGGY